MPGRCLHGPMVMIAARRIAIAISVEALDRVTGSAAETALYRARSVTRGAQGVRRATLTTGAIQWIWAAMEKVASPPPGSMRRSAVSTYK